jgi:hypothetical protein
MGRGEVIAGESSSRDIVVVEVPSGFGDVEREGLGVKFDAGQSHKCVSYRQVRREELLTVVVSGPLTSAS